jgi:hypothetical protein
MVKFQPTKLSEIAWRAIPLDFWDVGKAALYDTGLHLITGKEPYVCGNVHCLRLILFDKASELPSTYKYCGSGINWLGIKTRYIMRCNVCQYFDEDLNAEFCPNHPPEQQVRLMPKEVPM